MEDMQGFMSDKEPKDRLTNGSSGHFIVDGFTFKATEIVAIDDDFKTFKITCVFYIESQTLFFINLMKKKHFYFGIPRTLAYGQATCIRWQCFNLSGVFDCLYSIYCYISLNGLMEDVADGDNY